MESIEVEADPSFDAEAYCQHIEHKYRHAKESDADRLINRDCRIVDADSGDTFAVYVAGGAPIEPARSAVRSIDYISGTRQRGLQGGETRTFGFLPRGVGTDQYCRATALTRDQPQIAAKLMAPSQWAAGIYQEQMPEVYEHHMSTVQDEVLEDYAIKGTPFTSGIANKNYRIAYHFDAGNFQSTWSAMVCFREHCDGGRLALPEYDIKFEVGDKSLLLFNGQANVHGVTPIQRRRSGAYRYTVVYYSLKQLWHCLPPGDELRRARKDRTKREQKRAKGKAGELE